MTLNYKCSGCGAVMVFDPETQMLSCERCGNTMSINDQLQDQVETTTEEAHTPEPEYDSYHGYKCPSCGAEIVTDDSTAATFCSYCGNPTLLEDRIDNRRPTRVIPFKLTKKDAQLKFKEWTAKGKLTPNEFKTQACMSKITGIYVPFWLYDYDADVTMDARCTKVRREHHGDDEYVYTDHYIARRRVFTQYDMLPVDASEKMDDELMDMTEPFSYEDLKDFNEGFLSGYYAEKYTYTEDDMKKRAEARVHKFGRDALNSTLTEYTSVSPLTTNYRLKRTNAEYVMLPVWMLNYKWEQKMYNLAINGQTGKCAGTLPTSKAKVFLWWLGVTGVTYAIYLAFLFL